MTMRFSLPEICRRMKLLRLVRKRRAVGKPQVPRPPGRKIAFFDLP
jgi:hypothetical protein